LKVAGESLADESKKSTLVMNADQFYRATVTTEDMEKWAASTLGVIKSLNETINNAGVQLESGLARELRGLQESAQAISGDKKALEDAHNWAIAQLPVFIYLDEYPELDGHQNINQYI
jgi:hypothetical protein